MRASLCTLALVSFVGCAGNVPESTRQDDVNAPVAQNGAELRESCAPVLNELAVEQDLGSADSVEVTIGAHAIGLEECADLAWVRGFVEGTALITPSWAGPSLTTSGWDCNHSTLEYGVYLRSGAHWQFVDGAMAFGALGDDGVCGYSVHNFPRQTGSDETVVLAGNATEVRVGVRAWSHNDTAMGHAGSDCEGKSCYWPVRLSWQSY
ncbi:MAG TPA: hypothetical protein VM686_03260 [Polyangiaceae bacterium]|nr:hypothetical protein [Polyangiaceae bacterium]